MNVKEEISKTDGQERSRSCSKMSLLVFAFNYIPFMIACILSSTCIPDNLEIRVPHAIYHLLKLVFQITWKLGCPILQQNIEILSQK